MSFLAKPPIKYAIAIFVGILVGVSFTYFAIKQSGQPLANYKIEQGTDIVSVLGEEILFLNYRTEKLTITAQRSKPAARFAVQITYADGRNPQHCLSSADLAGQLASFATITAKRQIQPQQFEAEFPTRLGTLEIKDGMTTEPLPSMEIRANAKRSGVAIAFGGTFAEVNTAINTFTAIEGICTNLTQPLR